MTTLVHADLDSYRVAAAELPESAVASDDVDGAVVVVAGGGEWWAEVPRAIAVGAAAVVVAQPAAATSEALDALTDVTGRIPVIVERPLLRADVVAAVDGSVGHLPSPGALAVECHAPTSTLGPALRDAIGWARVIAGAPLAPLSVESWGGRVLALLESERGASVSIVAAVQPGAPSRGRVRITTIAETRIAVDADLDTVVSITDAAGRSILPALFESPERVALRRAIAAVRTAEPLPDLADLRHDAALAAVLLSGRPA